MPSKSRTFSHRRSPYDTGNGNVVTDYQRLSSNWKIGSNGKPDLTVQNPHYNHKATAVITVNGDSYGWGQLYLGGATTSVPLYRLIPGIQEEVDAVAQRTLARLKGRQRKGQASLGVTLGSWRQSLSMIKSRIMKMLNDLRALIRIGKRDREKLASAHLEVIFGWLPLIEDIRASFRVLGSPLAEHVYARASSTGHHHYERIYNSPTGPSPGMFNMAESFIGNSRVTCVAGYRVDNPNLFLLNQLGLLNPLVVAWDLIPWSFLVGMFVNVSSLLKSMTDQVGLTATSQSTTTTVDWTYTLRRGYRDSRPTLASGSKLEKGMIKERYTSLPSQSLAVRVPGFDLATVAMLASLAAQRTRKLANLLSI